MRRLRKWAFSSGRGLHAGPVGDPARWPGPSAVGTPVRPGAAPDCSVRVAVPQGCNSRFGFPRPAWEGANLGSKRTLLPTE